MWIIYHIYFYQYLLIDFINIEFSNVKNITLGKNIGINIE